MKFTDYLSIVLYTFNDQSIINESLNRVIESLKRNFENFEIIIVDDFSTDNTLSICEKFKLDNDDYTIKIIGLARKHGLEKCMHVGVNYSIGDYVVELDDPMLSFKEDVMVSLYNKSCEGYDVVSLKPVKNRNAYSNVFYYILNKFYFKKISGKFQTEYGSILSRRAINAMSVIDNSHQYRKVVHANLGLNKASLYTDETNSKGSSSFEEKIALFLSVVFTSTSLAVRMNVYLTLTFLLSTILVGMYSLYQYIFNESVVEGWTTTILYLSLSFFGVFLILSVIVKLLSIILLEVGSIPDVTIRNSHKL